MMHKILIVDQQHAKIRELDGDVIGLKPLQEIVGGYIDVYPIGPGLIAVFNDEGLLMDLPETPFASVVFRGPVAVVRGQGDQMIGLSEPDIKALSGLLSQPIKNQ